MTAPARRRVAALAAVLAVAGGAAWWFARPPAPVPPPVPAGLPASSAAAVEEARAAVTANPRSGDAWGRLGLHFTAHGFDDESAACYRVARRLDPGDPRWPYLLALYHLTDGRDPAAARADLEAALAAPRRDKSEEAAARLRLAELHLDRRELADAERHFRARLDADPADARAAIGLGVTLLAADRPADAVPFLRRAADGPFTRKKALSNLAVAARLTGDAAVAGRYEADAALAPDDPPPPDPFTAEAARLRPAGGGYDEAAALERQGRLAETIPILAKLAEDPAEVRAAVALGQNLAVLGHHAAAERQLRAATARDPAHAQAAFLHATVLFDLARAEPDAARKERLLKESADASGRAVRLSPALGMAHYARGRALLELGDRAAGLDHLRRAAECRPEVPQVQFGLLRALVDAGQLAEARARLPVAAQVIPAADPAFAALRDRLAPAPPPR